MLKDGFEDEYKEEGAAVRRSKQLREAEAGKKDKIVALFPLISRKIVNGTKTG